MKQEFLDSFEDIFQKSIDPLVIALVLKLRAIKSCQEVLDKAERNPVWAEPENEDDPDAEPQLIINYNVKCYTLRSLSHKKVRKEIMEDQTDEEQSICEPESSEEESTSNVALTNIDELDGDDNTSAHSN